MIENLRRTIRTMSGYVPGEQPRDGTFVKLNTNENPFPPSPRVFEALREAANCYVLPSALGVSVTPSRACQRTRVKPNRVEGDGEGKPQD